MHDCSSGDAAILAQSGSTLSHCTAYGNRVVIGIAASEGCTLDHCAAFANTSPNSFSTGINSGTGSTVTGCTSRNNTTTNATPGSNTAIGILTASGTIKDSTASGNDGDGIQAGVTGPVTIEGCTAHTNQGNGISVLADGSVISTCVSTLSGKKTNPFNTAADGIKFSARTRVVNCTAFNNAQHGIEGTSGGNRGYIEGCVMQGNGAFAIAVPANTAVIIRNEVGGNSGGTINQTGGNIGPIQNASDAAGSIHPLANFP